MMRFSTILLLLLSCLSGRTQDDAVAPPPFNVLVVASRAKDHLHMISAARPFFEKMALDNHFNLDFTDDTSQINKENLARYQVFVMLHLAPFDMSSSQQEAMQQFVESGKGWVGIHAAGLTGTQFLSPNKPNQKYWQWFEDFMGGIIYSPHPKFQTATLVVEDRSHPVTRHMPEKVSLPDEWYEFNKSPRDQVRVLATVDESSYHQNKPMGDHPIIWTNERFRRMIYIGVGHDSSLLSEPHYALMLKDAILWAASPSGKAARAAVKLFPIPMKSGRVYYEKAYTLPRQVPAADIVKRFRLVADRAIPGFPGSKLMVTKAADEALTGTGECKVSTDNKGGYYMLRFDWRMEARDGKWQLTTDRYYEKPVMKGISNEFSKIEYRWWDYRRGYPWSQGDQRLFQGIDSATRALFSSLYTLEDQLAAAGADQVGGAGADQRGGQAGSAAQTGGSTETATWAAVGTNAGEKPRFRILALYENGGHHLAYSTRARQWLDQLAASQHFAVDYITHTDTISDEYLKNYALIIQLDFVPYAWKPGPMAAFQRYIEEGRGGWIGFHHATLLGEFDGYPMWPWFHSFMGSIRFKDYIGRFAKGTVHVEDKSSPIMRGVPDSFEIQKEEWYTYDKSPRPNVHVIANVDESSYRPDTTVKMGDHPVIWSNPKMKARNVYIFMGHDPGLFDNDAYRRIFFNAIFWAANAPIVIDPPRSAATRPKFRALALYSTNVESDHVDFAKDAIKFYSELAARKGFAFDTTTDWNRLDSANLRNYQVVVWLNEFPHNEQQRRAFEGFVERGGSWLGFHVSAYNDRYTKWRWFVDFLGGTVFYNNNWPPLPARLVVDDRHHPVTEHLPARYTAPINEWYGWRPSARLNKDVKVLVTLDTANYPLGKKDVIREGDIPVVWTNQKYHMLYLNMGHGDQVMRSSIQNKMFEDAIMWLGGLAGK